MTAMTNITQAREALAASDQIALMQDVGTWPYDLLPVKRPNCRLGLETGILREAFGHALPWVYLPWQDEPLRYGDWGELHDDGWRVD